MSVAFTPQFSQTQPGLITGYSRSMTLKAPFPAFGGKSKVASLVWSRLGNVANYIEPFANSAAVLLARPHPGRVETINDWDCYVANFWRATREDAAEVAYHADNPVNEADLHARHRWLVLSEQAAEFRQRMRTDPDYYDAKVAGWWCWGACCWIGSGWCREPQQLPHLSHAGGQGLTQQLPHLSHAGGQGLTQQSPHLDPCGRKVATGPEGLELHGSRPELHVSHGVHADHRPQLADAYSRGRGVNGNDHAGTCEQRLAWLTAWLYQLRDRLRTVRVCCGDWIRVCDSPSTTTRLGLTGVFLDAPYKHTLADGKSNRSKELYASDRDQDVNALVDRVIAYCVERGSDKQMRIAACCYEGEGYEVLAGHGWTVESWKASGGYGNQSGAVNENASRERIWFSPHCRPPEQRSLFEEPAA
jgi:hypothetical protein